MAFNYLEPYLTAPAGTPILDAGCGSGRHSIRLANLGFGVTAIDFSDYIVEDAKKYVADLDLQNKITVQQNSLLELTFPDESFDYILCWGVLMHIPEVDKAIKELSRVLKKGGTLIISEVNKDSLETRMTEALRPLMGKAHIKSNITNFGVETWAETSSGKLMSRKTDVKWLENEFKSHDIQLLNRHSGQFTELYRKFSSKIMRKLIHSFNNFWFKFIKLPSLACGNIFVFKKETK